MKQIVADLPPDPPAAILVTLHLAATAPSPLATILGRRGGIRVVAPRNGDPLKPGYMYVASPDRHLELSDGTIRLTRGPKVNGVRPAIDVLFRSAAGAYGKRVVGVVLSGGLDDGSAGLTWIRAAGGIGIVAESRRRLDELDAEKRHRHRRTGVRRAVRQDRPNDPARSWGRRHAKAAVDWRDRNANGGSQRHIR